MKKILTSLLLFALCFTACGQPTDETKVQVTATFYPLAFFAQEIGGDRVQVSNLTPVGGEPHGFEPSPRQIVQVTESDVVLYLGEGFEPWMDDLETELDAKGVVALAVNTKLPLVEADEEQEEGALDPHTWLDPLLAEQMVTLIAKAFVEADPEGEAIYMANAETVLSELQTLHETYKDTLQTCVDRTLLTSHDAFTYLSKRYDLDPVSVTGLSPEDEPSADRLAELADFAKKEQSKYIFFETLENPAVAETLAKEAGLTPLIFNPLEGLTEEQILAHENYFTLMQANLANLRLALSCTDSSSL